MPVIETKNLVRRFGGTTVLRGIDLRVEEGEIFGLIGPSGAGKSTLLRTLTGYLKPTEGEVRVFGRPPEKFGTEERRRLGVMPQKFVLYENLSVKQNLNFVARLYDLSFFERRRKVREALEFVELWEHRRKAAGNISGGMQRRLQLAAAIVHSPRLLFVDEPTASLDPILRRRFWDEFVQLREQGRTLFVTTQYVDEAARCDRVGFLANGTLAALGTPDELRRQAFGGEVLELTLGGEPGQVSWSLSFLKDIGHVVEVREDEEAAEGPVSHARLIVDDADVAMPQVFSALNGADVRSVDILKPSFDEVFFRLVRGNS
ncbi:ABC transporter ATP-binding protein [Rubrobacter taiwanensis]|jgi:ABC-2 type transport system ATP-binding protein|uniref:ABC transporter ATP-binding protein n=1 Tax=Rubrobacter taiwanensis TaxID=185139 RepID=A0A4R1BRJ9_9ACTN|nr:ABC transporter ATP-binding protein [Rubrobacter taiwanensis]TCJ19957.1 ABC transporter ATP-binding protein [Rubrobacter taiwanensis]